MNFVFISPNFPETYHNFCSRLKQRGVRVLGVGDCPWDNLAAEVKNALDEYYFVPSLHNYEDVFRAVAWFSYRWGKIDWVESNNECWLELDARLRDDFGIRTGDGLERVESYKSKSGMKPYYAAAGVPAPRCRSVVTADEALSFAHEVGYPVFAKPDFGVGAEGTCKISTDEEARAFFATTGGQSYALEEFVTGDIYSYDAIVNSKGEILFESSAAFPPSMAEVVEKRLDFTYRVLPQVPEQLRERGRAALKSFGIRSRFVHFEFFRLTERKEGLGEVGDFVALEANMRPAGGYTPDMINYAHSCDVYSLWADMVVSDRRVIEDRNEHGTCVYTGRRDEHTYERSRDEVRGQWGWALKGSGRMPDALANDLGNDWCMALFPDAKQADEFVNFTLARA